MTDYRSFRFRGTVAPAPHAPIFDSLTGTVGQDEATLRIYDPIDSWGGEWGVSAKEFARALDEIGLVSTIHLRINSPGGEVWDGIAILNALREHPARVIAHIDGLAASAASLIACGCDEVIMGKNSRLMIHDAWGIAMGPASVMRQTADLLDKTSDDVATVYATKAGGTGAEWRDAMKAESWYTADEAVSAGLADSVAGAEQSPQNRDWGQVFGRSLGEQAAVIIPPCTAAGCGSACEGCDVLTGCGPDCPGCGMECEGCSDACSQPDPGIADQNSATMPNILRARHRANARKI